MTPEFLEMTTPEKVLDILKKGNRDFAARKARSSDALSNLAKAHMRPQAPLAIVLSCIDSRVPVEIILHMCVGDLFVARVAGNIVNEDILASMEYACQYAGSRVILILGHQACGAVSAACSGIKGGNLTGLLGKIEPAIKSAMAELSPSNEGFEDRVIYHNVMNTIAGVRAGSPQLLELEQKGRIKIVGGIFHLESGLIDFL